MSISRARYALAGLTLLTSPLPWLAHTTGVQRLEAAFTGGLGSIEIDLLGITMERVGHRRGGWEVSVAKVELRPSWQHFDVHVHQPRIRRRSAPARTHKPAKDSERIEHASPSTRGPARIPNHGIPIRLAVEGELELELGGAQLAVHHAIAHVDKHGAPHVAFEATASHPRAWVTTQGAVHAEPLRGWDRWAVRGAVSVSGGPATDFTAELSKARITAELGSAPGGHISLAIDPDEASLALHANNFALNSLGDAASGRLGNARFDVRDATVDGDFDLRRHNGAWHAHAEILELDGGSFAHTKVSARDLVLGRASISGDVSFIGAAQFTADVQLEHDELTLFVTASRSGDQIELSAQMPTMPCQSFLDAMPSGLKGVAGGSQLEGEFAASFELSTTLKAVRAHAAARDLDPLAEFDDPGVLAVQLPFMEECRSIAEPAELDFRALLGAYRHRFVDADGAARSRTMAPGAPGYISLRRASLVAAAFVSLEDNRYWRHDGFDREQMRNALWHNLDRRRISRGASTISQQAARNLFLGVDRTIARKLQEAFLTTRLEAHVSKSRVLELYLNIIELGPGIHGIEDAAQYHFGKSAAALSIPQAIHLAKLAPAPSTYSKRYSRGTVDDTWAAQIHQQIRRLARYRVITRDQMQAALKQPLHLRAHES